MKRPAVFLDRDGTLIDERGYLCDPAKIRFYPNVVSGLRRLQKAGFKLVVITNQSAVGRGYITLRRLGDIHARFRAHLKKSGVRIDGIYFCPHVPDAGCACRKPAPALPRRAARALGIDLASSFVVGDQLRDVDLARNIGARGLLVLTGAGRSNRRQALARADKVTANVATAAAWILRNSVKWAPPS